MAHVSVRSPQREIALMRESGRIVAEVLTLVGSHDPARGDDAGAGRAGGGVHPARRAACRRSRDTDTTGRTCFPATLCVSIDDEVVHGIPDGRVLEEGQIVSIDVGVKKNGYFGDGARTFPVGRVSEEKRRLLQVTEESLYEGIEQARAGNHLHDISAAVQRHVEAAGFSVVRDLVGHGIGKNLHEEPAVPNFGVAGTGLVLKAGMTLAIEPMVNAGTYGCRWMGTGGRSGPRTGSRRRILSIPWLSRTGRSGDPRRRQWQNRDP